MRFALTLGILMAGLSSVLSAAPICPSTASTNTDCGFIITLNADGTLVGAPVPGPIAGTVGSPYDGGDDALIGVINNMSTVFNGSITLSGSGNGGGLFEFDGDGICIYTSTNSVSLGYCSASQKSGVDPADYQGPLNTFTNINAGGTMGTVVISGLAPGGTTFFSLESSPASINNGAGPVVTPGAPEPATMALLGSGFAALYLVRRKRKT